MATTARLALPYPVPADTADVPRDVKALADKLDPSATVFGQGTLAARPAFGTQGRLFYASDAGTLGYDTGTAWVVVGPTARPPLLSALPSSPADGDEIYYSLTGGSPVWHLRYSAALFASDGYGWVFLGGAVYRSSEVAGNSTANTVYTGLGGPTLTVPLAGIYNAAVHFEGYNNTQDAGAKMSFVIGAAAADDGSRAIAYFPRASAPQVVVGESQILVSAAGAVLGARYAAVFGGTATFNRCVIAVAPVRVK